MFQYRPCCWSSGYFLPWGQVRAWIFVMSWCGLASGLLVSCCSQIDDALFPVCMWLCRQIVDGLQCVEGVFAPGAHRPGKVHLCNTSAWCLCRLLQQVVGPAQVRCGLPSTCGACERHAASLLPLLSVLLRLVPRATTVDRPVAPCSESNSLQSYSWIFLQQGQ